jgi:hypothetical protein
MAVVWGGPEGLGLGLGPGTPGGPPGGPGE